jgi:hypothetical protein
MTAFMPALLRWAGHTGVAPAPADPRTTLVRLIVNSRADHALQGVFFTGWPGTFRLTEADAPGKARGGDPAVVINAIIDYIAGNSSEAIHGQHHRPQP